MKRWLVMIGVVGAMAGGAFTYTRFHKNAEPGWLSIQGETEVEPGKPAILHAVAESAKSHRWYSLDSDQSHLVVDSTGDSAVFSSAKAGKYRIAVAATDGNRVEIAVSCLSVGPLPPGPGPGPGPTPPPPGPGAKLWIMVIEESASRTPEHVKFFGHRPLIEIVKKHNYRLVDKDSKDEQYRKHIEMAGGVSPFVVITDNSGTVIHKGGLPAKPEELVATIKKLSGE